MFNCAGILVIDSSTMKTSARNALAGKLGKASVHSIPSEEFEECVTSSLWAVHCISHTSGRKNNRKRDENPLCCEVGESLLGQIDVVIPYSLKMDPTYDTLSCNRILNQGPNGKCRLQLLKLYITCLQHTSSANKDYVNEHEPTLIRTATNLQ